METRTQTYEGGYGQIPFSEASGTYSRLELAPFHLDCFSGGPTYCALASIFLAGKGDQLTESEIRQTVRWAIVNQEPSGGFRGRTCKGADRLATVFGVGASLAMRILLRCL